jgi:hypothetical protein
MPAGISLEHGYLSRTTLRSYRIIQLTVKADGLFQTPSGYRGPRAWSDEEQEENDLPLERKRKSNPTEQVGSGLLGPVLYFWAFSPACTATSTR